MEDEEVKMGSRDLEEKWGPGLGKETETWRKTEDRESLVGILRRSRDQQGNGGPERKVGTESQNLEDK